MKIQQYDIADYYKSVKLDMHIELEADNLIGKLEEPAATIFKTYKKSRQFSSASGTAFTYQSIDNDELKTTIVIQGGAGKRKDIEKIAKSVVKITKQHKQTAVVRLGDTVHFDGEMARILAESLERAAYEFDTYKTGIKHSENYEIHVLVASAQRGSFLEGLSLGQKTNMARQMVNEPANVMTPQKISDIALGAGRVYGFDVEVFDQTEIEKLNMPAYLNVAMGSENGPNLIVMKYKGNKEEPENIMGFVGKGLSYDTGGYSIKSKDGMLSMKTDMGGAAAVIGAISAISEAKLKVNITAVVAACENMISGRAYRPGDIIQSRGGKTIFIKSTDAEGRLTLIDAIDYIIKDLGAKQVVDIATLTGAQYVALGSYVTGVVSNHDAFFKHLENASYQSGEKVWRMPLFDEIKETIKHKEADITNAVREAGMITAGAFIEAFVGDIPWLHLDIAGPSWTEKPLGLTRYGATGVGVRTLYYLAKTMETERI